MSSVAPVERPAVRHRLWGDLAVLAALMGTTAGIVYWLGSLLMPFFLSAVLAYLLSPVADALQRRGLCRTTAAAILYGLVALGVLLAVLFLMPQVRSLHTKLPEYEAGARATLTGLQRVMQANIPELQQFNAAETITTRAAAYVDAQLTRLPELLFNVFTLLSGFVVIPVMAWYFLLEGLQMKKALVSLVPNRYFETVLLVLHRVDQQLSRYVAGQLVDALIVGLLSVIGYTIIGVHYGFMIGMLTGLANLIPFVGPISGAAVALIVTILDEGVTAKLVSILFVATVVQVLDGHVIQPTVLSKSVNLHPLTVLAILLVGGDRFGLWGLLFGIPVYCVAKICLQELLGVIRRHTSDAYEPAAVIPLL